MSASLDQFLIVWLAERTKDLRKDAEKARAILVAGPVVAKQLNDAADKFDAITIRLERGAALRAVIQKALDSPDSAADSLRRIVLAAGLWPKGEAASAYTPDERNALASDLERTTRDVLAALREGR